MRLEFHKKIPSDISQIMHYYEDVAGPQLAEESTSPDATSPERSLLILRLQEITRKKILNWVR
jgi:hypothetical protein